MSEPAFYALTPTDIMALRLTCRGLRSLGGGVNMGAPYILYVPASETFCLHAYGSPQATSLDLNVLGAMLRAERAEPGFIRRVLGSEEPCDVATLDPAARARHAAQQAAERARQRLEADDNDEARWAARRASMMDPAKISLDDL